MMSFRGDRLSSLALPTGVVWFIDEIAEAKGRQALYTRQAPQVLKALRDMALVQSAESSTLAELERACPAVSRDMIRRVLAELRQQKAVECIGRGPGAAWRRLPERM